MERKNLFKKETIQLNSQPIKYRVKKLGKRNDKKKKNRPDQPQLA